MRLTVRMDQILVDSVQTEKRGHSTANAGQHPALDIWTVSKPVVSAECTALKVAETEAVQLSIQQTTLDDRLRFRSKWFPTLFGRCTSEVLVVGETGRQSEHAVED